MGTSNDIADLVNFLTSEKSSYNWNYNTCRRRFKISRPRTNSKNFKNENIFITGGAGYVGSVLLLNYYQKL